MESKGGEEIEQHNPKIEPYHCGAEIREGGGRTDDMIDEGGGSKGVAVTEVAVRWRIDTKQEVRICLGALQMDLDRLPKTSQHETGPTNYFLLRTYHHIP